MSRRVNACQWKWGGRRTAGQAVVLLLALLVAMAAMAFWLLDTHRSVLARLRAQDAGDPVALAAAKWQAAGLNLIGELNLIHAYMLADDEKNAPAALALHELQQRISLTTPMLALQAAQQVARQNNAQPIPAAREFLQDCAKFIRFPNFYEGATEDFHEMLEAILREDEIYAFPISPIFSDANSKLGNQDFYEAVLANDYCWFWFNDYNFLETYRSRQDFGAMPEISTRVFFSLGVETTWVSLASLREDAPMDGSLPPTVERMNEQMRTLGHPDIPPPSPLDLFDPTAPANEQLLLHPWMVYNSAWSPWEEMRKTNLPIRAAVRPEFDVLGTYAVTMVMRNDYPWMAAAKPFGSVGGEPPRASELLLGGFDAVRLVPIDALEAGLHPFEPAWLRHIYFHLHDYVRAGTYVEGCRYCRALNKWDWSAFRPTASAWLAEFGHTCRRPKPGRGDSGGATYAH